MIFTNQHISPSNIDITGYLAFLVILLEKEHSSLHWCIKYKSSSKYWKAFCHYMGDDWTIETLKVMSYSRGNIECLCVKEKDY